MSRAEDSTTDPENTQSWSGAAARWHAGVGGVRGWGAPPPTEAPSSGASEEDVRLLPDQARAEAALAAARIRRDLARLRETLFQYEQRRRRP